MHDWFDHILYATRAQPEASAMLMEDRVITYGMLGDAIASSAQKIVALGLAPDALVALCIENPIRHMTVSLALFSVGLRAISIDPGHIGAPGLSYSTLLGDAATALAFKPGHGCIEVTEDWFAPDAAASPRELDPPF